MNKMENKNNDPSEQNLKTYLEYQRWMMTGPLQKSDLNLDEANTLLYLGAYSKIPWDNKVLGRIFNDLDKHISKTLTTLVEKGYIDISKNEYPSNIKLTENGLKRYNGIKEFLYSNATQTPIDVNPNSLIF